jgi:UDP-2,3-diacylglucosamine hydrolase
MTSTTPGLSELLAPAGWQVVDFISDLHLQATEPHTLQAWEHYMAHTQADAVFILGDLFEVWIGDDAAHDAATFEARCAHTLRAATAQRPVFLMHGNRDFLLGEAFARSCGITLLTDPATLRFGAQRWLLSHGDALCLDDRDYLQFRAQVRTAGWKQAFLAKPLTERRAIALTLRSQSEARKRSGQPYADVDAHAARAALHTAHASTLIHGHTHRPGQHDLGDGLHRWVLSDWDAVAAPPRAEVLRLNLRASGVQMQRLRATDAC